MIFHFLGFLVFPQEVLITGLSDETIRDNVYIRRAERINQNSIGIGDLVLGVCEVKA